MTMPAPGTAMTAEPTPAAWHPARSRELKHLTRVYFALQLVLNFGNGAVTQFLLAYQVDVISPDDKVVNLGIITTASALLSLVALPFAGWLSDGTRSSWGRRAPWMFAGSLATGAVIALFATATSIAAVLVLSLCLTIAYALVAAPLFAVLADRTPPETRGTVAAVGSLGQWVGLLSGVLVATILTDHTSVAFLVLAAVTLAGVPLAHGLRRDSRSLPPRMRSSPREVAQQFWVSPRRHPDFAWAFGARVSLYAGYTSLVSFMLYTLQDYLGLSRDDAADMIPLISLAGSVAVIVAIYPAGRISDRIGRRKAPVIGASIVMATSTLIPVFVPTVTAFVVAFAVAGFGFGIYLAVDQVLMTMVLPDGEDAAKDLGILNVASAAGGMLAPMIGSVAISVAGYEAMFLVASSLALVGAAATVPIRSVR